MILSFWEGNVSSVMRVSGRVRWITKDCQINHKQRLNYLNWCKRGNTNSSWCCTPWTPYKISQFVSSSSLFCLSEVRIEVLRLRSSRFWHIPNRHVRNLTKDHIQRWVAHILLYRNQPNSSKHMGTRPSPVLPCTGEHISNWLTLQRGSSGEIQTHIETYSYQSSMWVVMLKNTKGCSYHSSISNLKLSPQLKMIQTNHWSFIYPLPESPWIKHSPWIARLPDGKNCVSKKNPPFEAGKPHAILDGWIPKTTMDSEKAP